MGFTRTILVLLRRREVTVSVLLLSLGLTAAALFLVPTQYTSRSIMILAPSSGGSTTSQDPNKPTTLTNPLLNIDAGLKTAGSILIQVLSTKEVTAQLGAGTGSGTTLQVDDGSTSAALLGNKGPFLVLEGTSTSRNEAHDVVVRAKQRARQELDSRQEALNAPRWTFITLVDVVAATTPEATRTIKFGLAVGGLVFGLVFPLGVAYGAQRLREGNRWRGGEPVGPTSDPASPRVNSAPSARTLLAAPPPSHAHHAQQRPDDHTEDYY